MASDTGSDTRVGRSESWKKQPNGYVTIESDKTERYFLVINNEKLVFYNDKEDHESTTPVPVRAVTFSQIEDLIRVDTRRFVIILRAAEARQYLHVQAECEPTCLSFVYSIQEGIHREPVTAVPSLEACTRAVFQAVVISEETEASKRVQIKPDYPYILTVHKYHITLEDRSSDSSQQCSWPLTTIRKFGHNDEIFSFEAGRACATGEGVFVFIMQNGPELVKETQQIIANWKDSLNDENDDDDDDDYDDANTITNTVRLPVPQPRKGKAAPKKQNVVQPEDNTAVKTAALNVGGDNHDDGYQYLLQRGLTVNHNYTGLNNA